ncbi:hypothetical protein PR048_022895 [Dryococelus australis]|uniref:Uncharacterized protein n=1 Tax=Dryococelus australis TaxID=614101 RepID=A0ABQ9GSI9_9NEOP|nr:hypothetical protein PR048_022895 [Dryococelus australis]
MSTDKQDKGNEAEMEERHDNAFRHAIPEASQYVKIFSQGILQSSKPTDPTPSTAANNVGFSSAKTFWAVINFPRKLLSEATCGPSQNKLRPFQIVIKILQGLLCTTPTNIVSPMAIYYYQFNSDKTSSVNGALLHCDNGRLDNSHTPSVSSDSLSDADSLTGHLREAALKVVQCAALEDESSPLAQAIYALRQILHD